MMKIGIGLTTHNRNDVARETFENLKKFAPEGAKIVVVDDASKEPFKGATHRFNVNVGVAQAKNKCLELLDDCDFIFLFDDDCRVKIKGWWLPYVTSGINHLSFTFDTLRNGRPNGNRKKLEEGEFNVFENPCGCVLFFTKKCLEVVGGFNPRYERYGFEHVDLSVRIYNAGLTPHKFMDVKNSLELFDSLDWRCDVLSSVQNRGECIHKNKALFRRSQKSKEFIPYRGNKIKKHKNVILTSFFNYEKDPQRGIKWKANIDDLRELIESCIEHKQHLFIFSNCFEDSINSPYVHFINTRPSKSHSPNVYRWIVYDEWMNHNDFDKCWMVDSTDVRLLKEPFKIIKKGKLYVGCEHDMKTDNDWMRRKQERWFRIKDYRQVIQSNAQEMLINCGIVGGENTIIRELVSKWAELHKQKTIGLRRSTDMAIFNYVCRKYFNDVMVYGDNINTRFKKFEENNKVAIWKHK